MHEIPCLENPIGTHKKNESVRKSSWSPIESIHSDSILMGFYQYQSASIGFSKQGSYLDLFC